MDGIENAIDLTYAAQARSMGIAAKPCAFDDCANWFYPFKHEQVYCNHCDARVNAMLDKGHRSE